MKKIIFFWVLSLIVLSSFSVNSQTVPKDTSQVAQDILKLKAQNDTLKMEFEKFKNDNFEKSIANANLGVLISTLVVIFVTLIAIVVGIYQALRVREIKSDYKETKAELIKRFEEDLEKVKGYKEDVKKICDEIKEKRVFAEREIQEIENFKKNMQVQQEKIPIDFSKEISELAKKDSKTAIEDYERIMNNIFDEEIYRTMAYNYYVEKKYDESIIELKKVIKLKPNYAEAYNSWGVALMDLGRREEAIEKYKKAIELKPDYTYAYCNWGVALGDLGRQEEAIEKFKKAIELKPDDEVSYNNWGASLDRLGRYPEAIEKYKKATELKPNFAKAWYNMAGDYSLQNKKKETLENMKRAIELDPKYKEEAKKDLYFRNLWEDEDFKRLVE